MFGLTTFHHIHKEWNIPAYSLYKKVINVEVGYIFYEERMGQQIINSPDTFLSPQVLPFLLNNAIISRRFINDLKLLQHRMVHDFIIQSTNFYLMLCSRQDFWSTELAYI